MLGSKGDGKHGVTMGYALASESTILDHVTPSVPSAATRQLLLGHCLDCSLLPLRRPLFLSLLTTLPSPHSHRLKTAGRRHSDRLLRWPTPQVRATLINVNSCHTSYSTTCQSTFPWDRALLETGATLLEDNITFLYASFLLSFVLASPSLFSFPLVTLTIGHRTLLHGPVAGTHAHTLFRPLLTCA